MGYQAKIRDYMTIAPRTIGFDQPISHANEFMRRYRVRHLPILKAGELIGVITDRDIAVAQTVDPASLERIKVEDACADDPYIVSPETPLNEVVANMAEKKISYALIADNNKLIGIFTEVDAYRAMSHLLEMNSGSEAKIGAATQVPYSVH